MSRSNKTAPTAATIVDFIADIFARRGSEEYLGEGVTMAEHMLQCAALAEREEAGETAIAAALLHDIGHFTSEFGSFTMRDRHDRFHEQAGARLLEPFFPAEITACVRWHVAAKRYLCAVEPGYRAGLSAASVHSLNLQGGPMSREEAEAFAAQPYLETILRVRRWDDAGKVVGLGTPTFAHFAPLLRGLVEGHGRTASAA